MFLVVSAVELASFNDRDGNGVELYHDRPREEWPPPPDGGEGFSMYTRPVDLQALLAELDA
jgi:catechol 2,3-dioxygenase